MKLYIDSSNNLKTLIKFSDKTHITTYQNPREQDVIGALLKALRSHHKTIQDLSSIQVAAGPGSFTGIRVGISIAQSLSLALNIPINNQPPGSSIQPNYGKKPSITYSRKNLSS